MMTKGNCAWEKEKHLYKYSVGCVYVRVLTKSCFLLKSQSEVEVAQQSLALL